VGKRSTFPRIDRDAYDTPAEAVSPLLEHLKPHTPIVEPCCGHGCLVQHLEHAGNVCVARYDLPDDAQSKRYDVSGADAFITNSPWTRSVLHPIIVNLSDQLPTWLLIDSDWLHTKQSIPFLPRLQKIVSIGRVSWIPGSSCDGKDNAVWCLFDLPRPNEHAAIHFHGRIDSIRAKLGRKAA
jgi:hypothetical protein